MLILRYNQTTKLQSGRRTGFTTSSTTYMWIWNIGLCVRGNVAVGGNDIKALPCFTKAVPCTPVSDTTFYAGIHFRLPPSNSTMKLRVGSFPTFFKKLFTRNSTRRKYSNHQTLYVFEEYWAWWWNSHMSILFQQVPSLLPSSLRR